MYTLTYLPFGSDGFLLTHSREEKVLRPAAHPQDPQGWGNWIASGEHVGSGHLTASLLNGDPENALRINRHNALANAIGKLGSKTLHLTVLHLVNYPGATFGHDTNRVTRLHRDSHIQRFGLGNRQHRERGGRKTTCLNRVVTLPL